MTRPDDREIGRCLFKPCTEMPQLEFNFFYIYIYISNKIKRKKEKEKFRALCEATFPSCTAYCHLILSLFIFGETTVAS